MLLATFGQMRLGELAGLRRDCLDLDTCEARIIDWKASSAAALISVSAGQVICPPVRQ